MKVRQVTSVQQSERCEVADIVYCLPRDQSRFADLQQIIMESKHEAKQPFNTAFNCW